LLFGDSQPIATPAILDALRERKDTLNAWVSELVDSYEQLPLLLQFEVLDFLEIDEDFLEVAGEEDKDDAGAGGDGTGSAGTSGSGTQHGSGEDEVGVRGEAKNAREVAEKESSGSGLRLALQNAESAVGDDGDSEPSTPNMIYDDLADIDVDMDMGEAPSCARHTLAVQNARTLLLFYVRLTHRTHRNTPYAYGYP